MAVKIVYHGHSNIEIFSDGHTIQVDPFYDNNPLADVKAKRVSPQFILLTHAHFDHTDDAEAIAKKNNSMIAANYEIASHYEKKGLRTRPLNHGGGFNFPFGRATLTHAIHTSSFPDGTYGGNPVGWVIETGGKTIYHAGDTALFGDMELIGKLWRIDLACLPIGDCFTMGPEHALLAAKMLGTRHVLPVHYNTFPEIKQDAKAFSERLKLAHGIEGHPLNAGESMEL